MVSSNADAQITRRRSPFFAALLSLLTSGLGQLYNGQPRRAALFLIGDFVLMVAILKFNPGSFPIFLLLMLLGVATVGWKIASMVDAVIQSRRRSPMRLARYNRWYVYLGVWLLVIGASAYARGHILRSYETFTIPSASNIPTLMPGDHVMAVGTAPLEVHRGDVVIFRLQKDAGVSYIKRVIGMPGERIQLRNGQVFVNDSPFVQSRIADFKYPLSNGRTTDRAQYEEALPEGRNFRVLVDEKGPLNDTPEVAVPPGHYFVLGDERNNSLDSRAPSEVGFVPAASIYRKAAYIYWSKDWSRIGHPVE